MREWRQRQRSSARERACTLVVGILDGSQGALGSTDSKESLFIESLGRIRRESKRARARERERQQT